MGAPAAGLTARLLRPWTRSLAGIDRGVHAIAAASFLFLAARMGLMTYLAIFFVEQRGLELPLVGLGFLVENVLRAAVSPLAGAWSDRIGRRPVLLLTAGASGLVLPGFLLVHDAPALLVWSALAGLAQGPWFPTATAMLLDLAPSDRRQTVLSYHYGAIGVGYTVGVVPAGFLAQQGYPLLAAQAVLAFAAVGGLVALALRRAPPPEPMARRETVAASAARAARDPAFLALALLGFLFPLGMGLVSFALPAYAKEAGLAEGLIGLGLGASGLLLAAIVLPINARIEHTGPFRWLPLAALLAAASYVAFAAGTALPLLAAGLLAFTLAEALFSSALPTAVAGLAPPGMRGAYQGAWTMVVSLGIGSALVLAGLGRDAVGWSATWVAFAALTLLAGAALAAAWPWFRRLRSARAADGAAE